MPLPTNFITTSIAGTDCIGDSRGVINTNFSTLLSAVSSVWNYADQINITDNSYFKNNTTITNCVSALSIVINGTTLYLPLLSSYN